MAPFVHSTINNDVVIETSHIPEFHTFDVADVKEGEVWNAPDALVKETLRKRIQEIDHNTCEAGDEDAFFVADLGEVYRHHMQWKTHLKRVKPHYGKLGLSPESDA